MAPVKAKFKANELVTCVEPFVTSGLGGAPFPVRYKARFRADHPVVKLCPDFFVSADAGDDEIARRRADIYQASEAQIPPRPIAAPPPPLQARDAVLRRDGQGRWTPADDPRIKDDPGAYVPVLTKALQPEQALVAQQTIKYMGEDGQPTRTIFAGQWVSRDDPAVLDHPHVWGLPDIDGREAA
jgi:hypothetical protein